jgi:hypothetical protein
MAIPNLFFGSAESGQLVEVGVGYSDMGSPYVPLLVTVPSAPASTVGEAAFSAVYLTVEQRREPVGDEDSEEVEILLTPLVDGRQGETYRVPVRMVEMNEAFPPEHQVKTYEIGVSNPWFRDGVEVARFSPRGRFFQLRVELPSTDIQVVEAQVELEPLIESGRAVNDSRVAV